MRKAAHHDAKRADDVVNENENHCR